MQQQRENLRTVHSHLCKRDRGFTAHLATVRGCWMKPCTPHRQDARRRRLAQSHLSYGDGTRIDDHHDATFARHRDTLRRAESQTLRCWAQTERRTRLFIGSGRRHVIHNMEGISSGPASMHEAHDFYHCNGVRHYHLLLACGNAEFRTMYDEQFEG